MAASLESRFIEEYLKDRDPWGAATRAGVSKVARKSTVNKFMKDPVVLKKIQDATLALDPAKMVSPQYIIAKWQEIVSSPYSSAAEKNSALRELAKIMKVYPNENENPNAGKQNMILLPADVSLEGWEKAARRQQRQLKQEVRD